MTGGGSTRATLCVMEIALGIRRIGEGLVNSYLPGHGQAWTGGVGAALAAVQAAAT